MTFVYAPPRRPVQDVALAKELVTRLNDLCEDPAVRALVASMLDDRLVVSEELSTHPTIQSVRYAEEGSPHVGVLGLINGLVGVDAEGWGHIAASYDEHGRFIEFIVRLDHAPVGERHYA